MMIVSAWLRDGTYTDRLLERVPGRSHAAVQELVYGAVKWQRLLAWRIARIVKRPPKRDVAALLLTAACELFQMDDSPPHAVVHENVAIARRRFTRSEAGFVNAALRSLLRDRAEADAELTQCEPALRLSHPDILWQRWMAEYGQDAAAALCEWNNGRAATVVRPQRSAGGMAVWLARWQAAGIAATPHPARPDECLQLPRGVNVSDLPGYAEGIFSVQDSSTLTAVDLLAPQSHERILDACAAPGGKTAVIADLLDGTGCLVAMDVSERRLRRLRENLLRLQRSEVAVLCGDLTARDVEPALLEAAPEGFDAILLDAPCSNTGVIRRRPDVRWRFETVDLPALVERQAALLNAAARLLRSDGRIIYSTCSLEPEENEGMLSDWLSRHSEFRLDREIRLFPPQNETDGAYAARLVRSNS